MMYHLYKRIQYFCSTSVLKLSPGYGYPKSTPLDCSIIFPDDKLINLEAVKWGKIMKTTFEMAFYGKNGVKRIKFKLKKTG